MKTLQSAWIVVLLAAVLGGCGSGEREAAVFGPNPGGGFYCPHNAFIGCAYP